jgi:hypothetical protein
MICHCERCAIRGSVSGGAHYQNERYGLHRRVFNPTKDATGKEPIYRCTVCGTEQVKK